MFTLTRLQPLQCTKIKSQKHESSTFGNLVIIVRENERFWCIRVGDRMRVGNEIVEIALNSIEDEIEFDLA